MDLDLSPHTLLAWYLQSGVDETIGDTAMDRFAAPARPAAMPSPNPGKNPGKNPDKNPGQNPGPNPVSGSGPRAVLAAPSGSSAFGTGHPVTSAHLAGDCTTLAQLKAAMEGFDGLPLKRTAFTTVFADGNSDARIMVVGEAPGQEEDRQGRPFVGRSGKLLDRMLASIGLDRTSAYITNVVPWRPTENRKPTAEEVAICLPFVTRHIELVDPALLILLGGAAASALLARHEGINRLRGRWFDYASPGLPRPIPAMASFHPAYLLRTPAAKRDAWRDLLQIKKHMIGHNLA